MTRILITCGETSGEERAASLVKAIRKLDPSVEVMALGGRRLEDAGAEVICDMDRFAIMGFSEIVTGLPRVIRLERKLKRLISRGGIDLFIPVDYPGLNLRLAVHAKKSAVPVLYFISPQVWAWGGWRLGRMRRAVDMMAVILPFEEEIYNKNGIPVIFTGHPMTSDVPAPERPKEAPGPGMECRILLFPGSRRQEVRRLLPVMLEAAGLIRKDIPEAVFSIGLAPLIDEGEIRLPPEMRGIVEVTREGVEKLGGASLVIAASGTVTLQAALSGTPSVVIYRTSSFTYKIGKALVKIPWIAMPNILAGSELVPELIQSDASPLRISSEAVDLLGDRKRYEAVSRELMSLRDQLEVPGGLDRLAGRALEMARDGGIE